MSATKRYLILAGTIRAYSDARWLHRGISASNIMISEKGDGILTDWEHGVEVVPRNPASFRMVSSPSMSACYRDRSDNVVHQGSLQFCSISLRQRPDKVHHIMDDLESYLWILSHHGVHFFLGNAEWKDAEAFDVQIGRRNVYASAAKLEFLQE